MTISPTPVHANLVDDLAGTERVGGLPAHALGKPHQAAGDQELGVLFIGDV
jgi:hypothetical protein